MKKEVISKFKEMPKTKVAWWAMILGLGPVLLGPILGVIAALLSSIINKADEAVGGAIGLCAVFIPLIFVIAAIITSVCAFVKGERSWVVWARFIPAILGGTLNIFLFGQLIFPLIFPH